MINLETLDENGKFKALLADRRRLLNIRSRMLSCGFSQHKREICFTFSAYKIEAMVCDVHKVVNVFSNIIEFWQEVNIFIEKHTITR